MKIKYILIIVLAISCIGCKRYTYVHDRCPTYVLPIKTKLEPISSSDLKELDQKTKNRVLNSIKGLMAESAQLRAILKSYNEFATERNQNYD